MESNQKTQSRRFSRFSLLLFALLVVFIGTGYAQPPVENTLHMSGYTAIGGCGNGVSDTFCCMTLSVTINRTGTKWFRIELFGSNGYNLDCIDWACIQGGWEVNNGHWIKNPPNPGNEMHIDFSGNPIHIDFETDSANGWTQGTVIEIPICAVPYWYQQNIGCYLVWNVSDFWTYDDEYPDNGNPIDHNNITKDGSWCGDPPPDCEEACDVIDTAVYKGSVDPPANDTTEICVKRNGGANEGTEIRVVITPPLSNPCPRLIDWTGKDDFVFHPGDTIWRKDVNGYWTHTYIYQGTSDSLGHRFDITDQSTSTSTILSFKPRTSNYNLAECGTFCIKIYDCKPKSDHTVKIETRPLPDDSSSCDQDSLIALKPVPDTDISLTGYKLESQQNYPNPFGAKTQFKTTIPFEIPNGGEVLISVFAPDGKEVTSETMSFETSGKHFFYFTGEQLPPGNYFYKIEFPKGNVIVSKQMLLVK